MNAIKVLVVAVVVSLTGCSQSVWVHSSKHTQEFYQDSSYCEALSYSYTPARVPVYGGQNAGSGRGGPRNSDSVLRWTAAH